MAKNTIADLDTTASNNTDVLNQSTQGTAAVSTIDTMIQNSLALLARFYADLGGLGTVGGTADAITLTTASTYQALESGLTLSFKAGSAITGASTINVDGLGAKAIRRIGDSATQAGDIVANGVYLLRYDAAYNSAAGAWILLNAAGASAATTSAAGIVELATAAEAFQASSTTLAVTPAGLANLYSIALNNAIEIADLKGSRLNMAGGIADPYDSETDVDTATSTNESYDSGNDLYSPTSSSATDLVPTMTSATAPSGYTASASGDFGSGYEAWRAFDKSNTTYWISDSTPSGGSPEYVQIQLNAAGTAGSYTIRARDTGDAGQTPGAWTLQGSNNGSSWTTLDTRSGQTFTNNEVKTYSIASPASYSYYRLSVTASPTAAVVVVAEITLLTVPVVNNMTLVSNAFTATAVPTVARIATFIDPQVSMTINTDFTAEASRDGGTTWTAATLALVSNPVGTVEQYEGTVSISAQPSGSSMKYRLKTLNNKDIDVTGTVFQWS
jgi:predicted RecA/RadA family phage recombinase